MLKEFWSEDYPRDLELYCTTIEAYGNAKCIDEAIEVFNQAKKYYQNDLKPYKYGFPELLVLNHY